MVNSLSGDSRNRVIICIHVQISLEADHCRETMRSVTRLDERQLSVADATTCAYIERFQCYRGL